MEQSIRKRYFELLKEHVARPAEEHLAAIAELGRRLVLADVPPKDIGEIHEEAILRLAQESPRLTLLEAALSTSAAMTEILMAYGLAFRARNAQLQRDITERQQAEESLRVNEERFALAMRGSNEGLWDWDIQNNLLYWSPRLKEWLGYADDELEVDFDTFESHLHPDDREHTGAAIEAHLKDRELYDVEQRLRTKSGEYRWFRARGQALWDEAGNPLRMVGSTTDITERKRAEEALRESEEKYRTILETIEDGYFEVDIAGNFTFFNDSLCRLLGYPEDELMDMNNREYMDDENARKVYQTFNTVYRTGKPAEIFDWEVIRKDGTRRFVESSVSLIRDSVGEPAGFRGVVRDITERKRAEEEAQRRAAQAALIYKVGQRVSGELKREVLLSEIVTAVRDAFDYPNVMLELLDEEAKCMIVQSVAGAYADFFPDQHMAIGEGMTGYAASTGETQVSSDVSQDPHYVPDVEETKSELAVPIKSGKKVIGVLDIQSDEFDAFDETEVMLMETLADQIAVAIENARLYEEIEERRLYLEGVLGAAPDAIVTLDAQHRIVEWNRGAEKLFGYSREEVIGQDIDDLITSLEVLEEVVEFTQVAMGGMEVPPTETVRYRKDRSPVDVLLAGSPIMVGDEVIGTVAVYTDITARKRMEETLRAMALLDELTDLYNRRGFSILAEHQLKMAERGKRRMLLLFADFDSLKRINDTFGHPEGDRALIETANVLRETFRESDIIARIGGDEFVVLAIETDGFPAEVLTTRLQEKLEARNAKGDRRYKLALSVGLARYNPERPCPIDELLAQADRAMYEKKRGNQKA